MSHSNDWRYPPVNRQDVVAIPRIWVTLVLSLVFHAAMLWFWLPRLPNLSLDDLKPGKAATVLVTRLVSIPKPVPQSPPPSPPLSSPPRMATPPIRRAPPSVAMARPLPKPIPAPPLVAPGTRPTAPLPSTVPPPPAAPVTQPAPVNPPPATDLAAYIEARRRARGEPTPSLASSTPPSESEAQRQDRIIAGNLAQNEQPTFGYDPKSGGGIFQLMRVGYDDAEFYFTGWDKEIGRRAKQLIEVSKGNNSDIRLAIVRKMIAIIRGDVQGDFTWKSERLGRQVIMSARPADTAALEDFLMQEFFTDPRVRR